MQNYISEFKLDQVYTMIRIEFRHHPYYVSAEIYTLGFCACMDCKNILPSRFQTPHPQTPIRIRILSVFFFYVKLSLHKTKQKQNRAKKRFVVRHEMGKRCEIIMCTQQYTRMQKNLFSHTIFRLRGTHTYFEGNSERVVARTYAKNKGREISNPNTYIMYKWLRWFYFLVFRRSYANLFFRFVSNKKMEKKRTRTCTYTRHTDAQ